MADQFAVINSEPSSELEKRQSQHLRQYLQEQQLYESQEESLLREDVLGRMDQVVKAWIKRVAKQCGMAESTVQEANAKIFTFGSYRLGVHAPGADIDVLCVGPSYAKRDTHFFGSESYSLECVLKATPGVTEVTPVPKAHVPVLMVKFSGLELDVLYASLAQFLIPETLDLSRNSLLRGCDDATVRSLNGCRVTDTILKSVPDVGVFRLALKAIKLWAEKRGIYSNVAGYLGGVNMALLVAKVCRWYPKKDAAPILLSLFMFFSGTWKWPTALHLLPQHNEDSMGLQVWDPSAARESSMPIITPCYPAMNSMHNVTRCTMAVMLGEFKRAFEVAREVLVLRPALGNGTNGGDGTTAWHRLFEPHHFFETRNAFYTLIEVFASSEGDLEKWEGWVRSRVRHLVRALEEHVNVRPHPLSLKPPASLYPGDPRPRKFYFLCLTKRSAAQAEGINPATGMALNSRPGMASRPGQSTAMAPGKVNITQPVRNFRDHVLQWDERRDGMDLRPSVVKQRDLPSWVFPDALNPLATPSATPSGNGGDGTPAGVGTPVLPEASAGPPPEPCGDGTVAEAAAGVGQVTPASTAVGVAGSAGPLLEPCGAGTAAGAAAGAGQVAPASMAAAAPAAGGVTSQGLVSSSCADTTTRVSAAATTAGAAVAAVGVAGGASAAGVAVTGVAGAPAITGAARNNSKPPAGPAGAAVAAVARGPRPAGNGAAPVQQAPARQGQQVAAGAAGEDSQQATSKPLVKRLPSSDGTSGAAPQAKRRPGLTFKLS